MKANADKKRRGDEFQVGEKVYVKLQPYRHRSLAQRLYEKLAAKFYGPFEVLQCIGMVAYCLQLPDTSKIHPVLHFAAKKSYCAITFTCHHPWSNMTELDLVSVPEIVVDVRQVQQGSVLQMEILIKCQGLPVFLASWEDVD